MNLPKNVIVSDIDDMNINKNKWFINQNGYVHSNEFGLLHRYIIKLMDYDINRNDIIDHINNNKLDNRRENLRIVSHSENARNRIKSENASSKYIGVSFHKKSNKWITEIRINDKRFFARYIKEEHAAHQYNLWVKEFKVSCAKINDIDENLLNDFVI